MLTDEMMAFFIFILIYVITQPSSDSKKVIEHQEKIIANREKAIEIQENLTIKYVEKIEILENILKIEEQIKEHKVDELQEMIANREKKIKIQEGLIDRCLRGQLVISKSK